MFIDNKEWDNCYKGKMIQESQPVKELLLFEPVLKETLWGGNRLQSEFGFKTEGENIGESWAISAHVNGDCKVKGGRYDQMLLSQLYAQHSELFGNLSDQQFPLLIKMIDANDKLSIQVHPDDDYAREHENGSLGKCEWWYIMDCPADAQLIIGHNAKSKEELRSMIAAGDYEHLIRRVPIKKGDFLTILPGTIHAITAGVFLLEIQESSDITYRVYDYERLYQGKKRQLHIEKSLEVINVPDDDQVYQVVDTTKLSENEMVPLGSYKESITVWKIKLNQKLVIDQCYAIMAVSVLDGNGQIDGKVVKKGDMVLVPSDYGEVELSGRMELMISTVGK